MLNATPLAGFGYDDMPGKEQAYYYAVTSVDALGDESEMISVASATADATPPVAGSITFSPHGNHDPVSGRMALGIVDILLTVSEPLQETPFLSITPSGGSPASVKLVRETELGYAGTFEIQEVTPTGTAYAVFSRRDMAGNRGTAIASGGSISIDTDGPSVIYLAILPQEPVKNDPLPVAITVTVGIDEAMKPGEIPSLSCILSAEGRAAFHVESMSLISTLPGQAQTWQAAFQLPADAGFAGPEILRFTYRGVDDLGNEGTDILCHN